MARRHSDLMPRDTQPPTQPIPFRRAVALGGKSLSLETDAFRSALMARVRQRGTKPETAVASILRALGRGYRKSVRTLPGSPDFANRSHRWAVFVNGCYWHHHHNCRKASVPSRNREFWEDKFAANRKRDARAIRSLRRDGFDVLLVWECETAEPERLTARMLSFFQHLDGLRTRGAGARAPGIEAGRTPRRASAKI